MDKILLLAASKGVDVTLKTNLSTGQFYWVCRRIKDDVTFTGCITLSELAEKGERHFEAKLQGTILSL